MMRAAAFYRQASARADGRGNDGLTRAVACLHSRAYTHVKGRGRRCALTEQAYAEQAYTEQAYTEQGRKRTIHAISNR